MTHDVLLDLWNDFRTAKIEFLTRSMQVFVVISRVLCEFNYHSSSVNVKIIF